MSDTQIILLGADFETIDVIEPGPRLLPDAPEVDVRKASAQKRERPGVQWVEPRIAIKDLLWFADVNTWHRRAIQLKARMVLGRGWYLEPTRDDADPEVRRALEALLVEPQRERKPGEQRQTLGEILFRFLFDWYATGNAYLEVVRDRKGRPAEFYHVRAERVRRDVKLEGGYWQLTPYGEPVHFRGWGDPDGEENEMLHFVQYDPLDDYYGVPEWLPAIGAMALDRAAVEYNTQLFANGLLAHFAVVVEGGRLTKDQIEALKAFLRENATGIKNAGRGIVLQNESDGVRIRLDKLNMDVKDLQFEKGRAFSRDEIASAHGVPPRLLGIMTPGQLGGAGEAAAQMQIFLETVIAPDRQRVEDFLNRTIVAAFGAEEGPDPGWALRFVEPDLTDAQADADYYTKALNPVTGWMRREEVREMEGLPPEEEAPSSVAKAADMIAELRRMLDL